MKPNLKLVNKMDTAELLFNPSSIQALVPKGNSQLLKPSKQKSSYALLVLVIVAHIAGLAWLVNAKPTPPAIKEALPPMMVSLVASPAPEPQVVPLVPTPPQPVIEKQKPIVKKKEPTPEPVAKEPEAAQPIVTETPPTPAAPIVVAKAPEVVEAPEQKVEPEPVIEPPRFGAAYLHNPAPDYPPLSRRLGEQGRVLLRVLVSTSGTAENVQVENSSGSNKLDQAAIQAVKKWTFIPAKQSNKAISAYVLVPVKFSLES
ncbi:MAG TPA: TonB family protein [Methylotenera sp.]|nr:TonB family protein [Methylotenera sp.]